MSKKPLLKTETSSHSSFLELQRHWYQRLEEEGFEDQENTELSDRPLKRWSGISSVYVDKFQPPGNRLVSSFPESVYKEQERFKNHPKFKELCIELCGHGNSRFTPQIVEHIWSDYCDGKTLRQSETKYGISDNRILVMIQRITEWMNLMDTREESEDASVVVVIRPYRPEIDNPFIYSTWRNALWFDKQRDERLADEFYSLASKQIKAILAQPETAVRIACAKDERNHILGYAVTTGQHLEFLYLKVDYRNKGIEEILTHNITSIAEPLTAQMRKLAKLIQRKKPNETIQ